MERKAKKEAQLHIKAELLFFGAGGRGRTDTVLLPQDFESCTSANSITPAYNSLLIISHFREKVNTFFENIAI